MGAGKVPSPTVLAMPVSGDASNKVPRTNLTEKQRHRVIEHLLKGSNHGALQKGDLAQAAEMWSCGMKQISRLWKRYQLQVSDGVSNVDLRNKRFGTSGRKLVDFAKLDEALRKVPLKNRTTQRTVAAELGISQQVLQRNFDKIDIRASKRFLRLLLTDAAKTRRLQWALSWIRSGPGGSRRFATMDNIYMVRRKIVLCEEAGRGVLPRRWRRSTRAQGPTQISPKEGDVPCCCCAPTQKHGRKPGLRRQNRYRSIHHAGGSPPKLQEQSCGDYGTTMVEVTKEVCKQKLLDDVFPAIKAKWPGGPAEFFFQQDNAPSHNIGDDPDIVAAGTEGGWNIKLLNQPPNSPDTNNLDLGFFNSIQSLQDQTTINTVDELIEEVKRAFETQTADTLARVWMTYHAVLEQILLAKGDNGFKLPHLRKATASCRGQPIERALRVSGAT